MRGVTREFVDVDRQTARATEDTDGLAGFDRAARQLRVLSELEELPAVEGVDDGLVRGGRGDPGPTGDGGRR